ncbi:MAG: DUF192 domain-containing protein, partial [Myxococcota bacterium]
MSMQWHLPCMVCWLMCLGCSTTSSQCQSSTSSTPQAKQRPQPQAQEAFPQVLFQTASGKEVAIHVELACTHASRNRGLMFRKYLPTHAGMLFVFPKPEVLSFWMK